MGNLFTWTTWSTEWQLAATVVLFFLIWFLSGFLTGYALGAGRMVHTMLKVAASVAGERLRVAANGWTPADPTTTGHAMIRVTPAVIRACKDLDAEAFHAILCEQIGLPLVPSDQVIETMHMMRADHPAFSAEEKKWSTAWLARKGFTRNETGGWYGPPLEGDNPTIN